MPRADRRRPAPSARRWSPWWLALPVLGLAAYAAFAATLSILGDDGSRSPSAAVAPPPPPATGGVAEPAAIPAPDAAVDADVATSAVPSAVPAASTTPAAQRAAVNEARKVNPKRVPQEHLTEHDRRALDALVEQAGKNAR